MNYRLCFSICLTLSLRAKKLISQKSHLWGLFFSWTVLIWVPRQSFLNVKYLQRWHEYLSFFKWEPLTWTSNRLRLQPRNSQKSHFSSKNSQFNNFIFHSGWKFKMRPFFMILKHYASQLVLYFNNAWHRMNETCTQDKDICFWLAPCLSSWLWLSEFLTVSLCPSKDLRSSKLLF